MNIPIKTLTFTGHRKIENLQWTTNQLKYKINDAISKNYETFITGGAMGIDQLVLKLLLKNYHRSDIYIIVARPFPSMTAKWEPKYKREFQKMLELVDEIVDVSTDPYTKSKYAIRDKWMVDNSNAIISVWDGRLVGGTCLTTNYATDKIPVYNINPKLKLQGWK